MRAVRRWVALLAAAPVALAPAAPVGAQSAGPLDFLAQRPLHARVALADAAAIASVERVDLGRVRLRDAEALFGAVPDSFEIKRAPSRPPPLAEGERALLFLRGARPPFVLVDGPEELTKLPDARVESRWRGAILALVERRGEPPALLELYRSWLETGDSDLQRAAVLGLGDGTAAFHPLPERALLGLVGLARDARVPEPLRRGALLVARLSLAGRAEPGALLRRELERAGRELP